MHDNFEVETVKFLDGDISLDVQDDDGQQNRVIEMGKPAKIVAKWWLKTTDPWTLNGTKWVLTASLEAIGQGPEVNLDPVEKIIEPTLSMQQTELDWIQEIPLDTSQLTPGVYKIVLVLTHQVKMADGIWKPTHLAGFQEFPMVQIYSL